MGTTKADAIRPFTFHAPQAELDELRRRIKATKWSEREPVNDETQGVQFATIPEFQSIGVTVGQQMSAALAGKETVDAALKASQTAAERELKKVKLLYYMSDKIGTELDGVITGVENFGLFVMGTEIPAEGFVHISSLSDDYYRYDRAGHVIAGHRTSISL